MVYQPFSGCTHIGRGIGSLELCGQSIKMPLDRSLAVDGFDKLSTKLSKEGERVQGDGTFDTR